VTFQTTNASRVRPDRPITANVYARAGKAMATTSHPGSTEIALQLMREGGSAIDAYVAVAFAQAVLEQDMTTIAGTFVVTHYGAADGMVGAIAGTLALPEHLVDDGSQAVTIDGRAVLVPGFVRGAWAAHQRWGKLSWARVLQPAIDLAHEGFVIDWSLWGHVFQYKQWAERTEAGRAIWAPDGHMLMTGDILRQPDLARTFEGLRDHGPDYFYTGAWARKCVEAVQAEGGVLTLADLAKPDGGLFVAPDWDPRTEASQAGPTYRGLQSAPANGLMTLALNLVEVGDIRSRGKPSESADSLYLLMRIAQEARHTATLYGPDTHERFSSKAYAEEIWPAIEHGPPLEPIGFRFGTCGVAISDPDGNVAVGTHSVSSSPFALGMYVDGVLLNRSLPLVRLSRSLSGFNTSALLLKDGKPAYAFASPSRSFFENLLQQAVYAVEFGMDVGEAAWQPRFGGTDEALGIARVETSIPDHVRAAVAARGMPLVGVAPLDTQCGSAQSLSFGEDGMISGAADPRRRGQAKGF
jgi:gamma-glutamyltranspeptidase/glutathione hydrolase